MALITRASDASIDTSTAMYAPQIAGLLAGEDLSPVAPCYVKAADGKVYQANGTAANEAAKCYGFTARTVKAGEPVTLFGAGTRYRYGTGLSIGTVYYVGATAGRLDNAATVGDAVGVAVALTATDIVIIRANGKNVA
jgi:hypothetical protein